MYHMAQRDIYDPDFFMLIDNNCKFSTSTQVTSRHCMGALYSYYKTGMGSS